MGEHEAAMAKMEEINTNIPVRKGLTIYEEMKVDMPTCFIILDCKLPEPSEYASLSLSHSADGTGIEITDQIKKFQDKFDIGMKWVKCINRIGSRIYDDRNVDYAFKLLNSFIIEDGLVKKEMYFYLVDELTGDPARGDGWPITITSPSYLVPKLLPLMQVGMRAMSIYNGTAGIARMFGVPFPKVPKDWTKGAQDSVEMLKKQISVEEFGVVQNQVEESTLQEIPVQEKRRSLSRKSDTVRGASLREFMDFMQKYDPGLSKGKNGDFAGLKRIGDPKDGSVIWTTLKKSADIEENLKERSRLRRELRFVRLVDDLHELVKKKASLEDVQNLLLNFPENANIGCEPLYTAISYRASQEVINLILNKNKSAAKNIDNVRFLPLHYAVREGCELHVLKALLDAYPEGAKARNNEDEGNLPLHIALSNKCGLDIVETLLGAYPDGAKEKNENGELPLHIAMIGDCGIDVVRKLLEAYRKGAKEKNEKGRLPLHLAFEFKCEHDAVKELFVAYTEGAKTADSEGKLPLHLAFENRYIEEKDERIIDELIFYVYDLDAFEEEDNEGRLPLHYIVQNGYPADPVAYIIGKFPDQVKKPDKNGKLPLHVALEHGQSLEVRKALLDAYPEGAGCRDYGGSLPLHNAVIKASEREDFIMVEALIREYPYALGAKNKDGYSPFEMDSEKSRGCQFTKFMNYLSGSLDEDWEAEDTEKIRTRREHERILIHCKDLMPLDVLRAGYKKTLDSKRFVQWLNGQLCNRNIVFIIVFQFYLHMAWIYTFVTACQNHFKKATSDSELESDLIEELDWRPIALMVFSSIFLWIELGQMFWLSITGAFLDYFLDWWNWLDILTSVMVIVSAVRFLDENSNIDGRLLMATGCLQSLFFLSYLKKTFIPFSNFVNGVIKIIWTLMPFLVVSTVLLFTFSFMYFVKGQDFEQETINYRSKKENSFAGLNPSFQAIFSTVAGGAEETKIPLDYIFGILIIIVLLNVVIAIVSDEWAKAVEAADESFWSYRLDLLIDQTRGRENCLSIYNGLVRMTGLPMPRVPKNWSVWILEYQHMKESDFGSGHLDEFFIDEDTTGTTMKEFKTKLAEESRKKGGVLKCIRLLIQCFVFIVLGFLTFGILWPRFFREILFTPAMPKAKEKESSDGDELLLTEYKTEVDKLSKKLNRLEENNSELLKEVRELLKLKKM